MITTSGWGEVLEPIAREHVERNIEVFKKVYKETFNKEFIIDNLLKQEKIEFGLCMVLLSLNTMGYHEMFSGQFDTSIIYDIFGKFLKGDKK